MIDVMNAFIRGWMILRQSYGAWDVAAKFSGRKKLATLIFKLLVISVL